MKVVALVSGGKDSTFAMMKCVEHGHEVKAVANLRPPLKAGEEMDSFMYQTVGSAHVDKVAEAMGVPFFAREIQGVAIEQRLEYKRTEGDEVRCAQRFLHDIYMSCAPWPTMISQCAKLQVEDLYELLAEVKAAMPEIDAVCCGAVCKLSLQRVSCLALLGCPLALCAVVRRRRFFRPTNACVSRLCVLDSDSHLSPSCGSGTKVRSRRPPHAVALKRSSPVTAQSGSRTLSSPDSLSWLFRSLPPVRRSRSVARHDRLGCGGEQAPPHLRRPRRSTNADMMHASWVDRLTGCCVQSGRGNFPHYASPQCTAHLAGSAPCPPRLPPPAAVCHTLQLVGAVVSRPFRFLLARSARLLRAAFFRASQAIVVKVASLGLNARHLGQTVAELRPTFTKASGARAVARSNGGKTGHGLWMLTRTHRIRRHVRARPLAHERLCNARSQT
eukprot:4045015-Pleurochrysis_carterae.AAC.1